MAKAVHNDVLDAMLDEIATADRLTVCSAEPANFAGIAAVLLAEVVLTAGDGNGPAVMNLPGTKPRDFTSSEFVIEGREHEIRETITMGAVNSLHGSEYMLEWGTKLSAQQIEDILEYIKTFKNP